MMLHPIQYALVNYQISAYFEHLVAMFMFYPHVPLVKTNFVLILKPISFLDIHKE